MREMFYWESVSSWLLSDNTKQIICLWSCVQCWLEICMKKSLNVGWFCVCVANHNIGADLCGYAVEFKFKQFYSQTIPSPRKIYMCVITFGGICQMNRICWKGLFSVCVVNTKAADIVEKGYKNRLALCFVSVVYGINVVNSSKL